MLARTRAIDYLRSRRAQIFTADFAPPTHTAPNPENIAADAQLCGRDRQALEILLCEQRRAIELAYLSGLTAIEVARQLNEPVGAIKTRVRLGLMKLRRLLAPAQ